jgi:hypothetical protein
MQVFLLPCSICSAVSLVPLQDLHPAFCQLYVTQVLQVIPELIPSSFFNNLPRVFTQPTLPLTHAAVVVMVRIPFTHARYLDLRIQSALPISPLAEINVYPQRVHRDFPHVVLHVYL